MLRTFGLKTQLYAGFGLIAVFVVVLGAFNTLAAGAASSQFGEYRSIARESLALAELESRIGALRTETFTYRIGGEEADPDSAIEANAALIAEAARVEPLITNDEARRLLSGLTEAAEDYREAFSRYVERSAERELVHEELGRLRLELRQEIDTAIVALRGAGESAAAFEAARVQRQLLLARYYADEFFDGRMPEDEERAREQIRAAERTIGEIGVQRLAAAGAPDGILEGIATFEATFEELLAVDIAAEHIATEDLDRLDPQMQADVDALREASVNRQSTIGPELAEAFETQQVTAVVIAIAGALLAVVASFIIVKLVLTQISKVIDALARIRSGDLNISISSDGRTDEIGQLCDAVVELRDSEEERVRLQSESEAIRAERDARTRATETAVEAFGDKVRSIIKTLNARTGDLSDTAGQLTDMAATADDRAQSSDAAASEAASSVETVASAAEELSGSIQEIARQTSDATNTVRSSVEMAGTSVKDIEALVTQAEEIGAVVDMINDIAEQTNLLALNATIEAARAGEAGKGFAVVASEVKSLSAQTAKATESIAGLVSGIQDSVGGSVGRIREVADMSAKLEEAMSAIASAVEEQSAATREISDTTTKTSESTNRMAGGVREVTQAVSAAKSGAGVVNEASEAFSQQAAILSQAVSDFFLALRTGPLDRREEDDPNYAGPERRGAGGDLLMLDKAA